MNEVPISSTVIIYAMSAVIATLSAYIAAGFRSRIKQSNEDKKVSDENTKEMTKALTMASVAIENNTKAMQQNTEALNIVKYKK